MPHIIYRHIINYLLILIVLMAFVSVNVNANSYQPTGLCNGLPKLALQTPKNFCVGLVAKGFKFPRGIQPMPNGVLWVLDMGGWIPKHGSLWKLTLTTNGYQRKRILTQLDRPNSITVGPDNKLYIGEVSRIFRISPDTPQQIEDVIGGTSNIPELPSTGRHPLTSLIFGKDHHLYVNIGSESDHCEGKNNQQPDPNSICPETQTNLARGSIRQYQMQWPAGKITEIHTYADGLRNSMALAIHPITHELWQGENSRDYIELADHNLDGTRLPHDEINRITAGNHYGWPYCYDHNVSSPEYPHYQCERFTPPAILLPAHAAPLGMTFYTGQQFPKEYQNQLIIGFHGYRSTGHRLMLYRFTEQGEPEKASPQELISQWEQNSSHPMGAPTDIKLGADGSIYISEDRNGTIVRLNYIGK